MKNQERKNSRRSSRQYSDSQLAFSIALFVCWCRPHCALKLNRTLQLKLGEMLLKFAKLNYDLINFWCLQHHHHRPFNLICVPIFVPQQNFELKISNFPRENFRDWNSISFTPPHNVNWHKNFMISPFTNCPRFAAMSARHRSHTGKLLFRSTQHNLSGYLCFVMCFMQFHVNPFYASYKDLFIYEPNQTAMAGKNSWRNIIKISSDSCVMHKRA